MKASPDQAQPQEAFRAMLRNFGLIKRLMEPLLSQYGVSLSQWAVLRAILRAEQEGYSGLRLKDIGKRLLVRPPSVSGVVRRLERLGLVTIHSPKSDQRTRLVNLSAKGRELLKIAGLAHSQKVEDIMAVLDDKEQHAFVALLSRLAEHLEGMTHDTITTEKEKE